MESKDFLTNPATGDLEIAGGDFVVGGADGQHIEDILASAPGDYKQWPLVGVNLPDYLNAPNDGEMVNRIRRAVQLQLESDGYQVQTIGLNGGIESIDITAERPQ